MRARRRPQGLVVHRVPAVKSRATGPGAHGVGGGFPIPRLRQATADRFHGGLLPPAVIQVASLDFLTPGR